TAGPTSASASCPTTSCTTAATRRSAARTARCRASVGRGVGPEPARWSAACTWRRRRGRERLRRLVHGALRRREDDDREHRRAGARAARARRRPSRRRHRSHPPLQGARLLEGGPRHEHRPHRLGRVAARARGRGGRRVGHLAVRGGAPARADARGAARAVRGGARGDAARGVRAARPEGPLRGRVRGRDRGLHRRVGPLRGAERPRAAPRHDRPPAERVRRRGDRAARGAEPAAGAGGGLVSVSRSAPTLTHLDELEAEAIHIFREVAAELERPVLLFSGGKDSIVLLRLAEKAFRPAGFPFPVMHVDTGHNFSEVIEFRDRRITELGERLIVASVQDSIDSGRVVEETGPRASRNRLQTTTLLDAIEEHGFDAAFGGARRDEERARAKERVFSFRDDFGQWDPKRQRPELWSLYNGRIRKGEHVRVFPISNWTELDVWQYIAEEQLEVPSIYYAHTREVFERDGMLYANNPYVPLTDGERP